MNRLSVTNMVNKIIFKTSGINQLIKDEKDPSFKLHETM